MINVLTKRGPKPKGKVKIIWSASFAYAVGLIVTDGNISKNGRHITFTNKDMLLIKKFKEALNIEVTTVKKTRGQLPKKEYYVVQFSDVLFWNFLFSIGLMPAKSKVIGEVSVPKKYFFDFLRGCFDGDGSFYSYTDMRWKNSFMYYISFISASEKHILWLQRLLSKYISVQGSISKAQLSSVYQLRYAKAATSKIVKNMYYDDQVLCAERKRLKMENAFKKDPTMPRWGNW